MPWPTATKPGGTLLGVTGPLLRRISKTDTDKYGRWTSLDLFGRDGRTVTIICAYQVPDASGPIGDETL